MDSCSTGFEIDVMPHFLVKRRLRSKTLAWKSAVNIFQGYHERQELQYQTSWGWSPCQWRSDSTSSCKCKVTVIIFKRPCLRTARLLKWPIADNTTYCNYNVHSHLIHIVNVKINYISFCFLKVGLNVAFWSEWSGFTSYENRLRTHSVPRALSVETWSLPEKLSIKDVKKEATWMPSTSERGFFLIEMGLLFVHFQK